MILLTLNHSATTWRGNTHMTWHRTAQLLQPPWVTMLWVQVLFSYIRFFSLYKIKLALCGACYLEITCSENSRYFFNAIQVCRFPQLIEKELRIPVLPARLPGQESLHNCQAFYSISEDAAHTKFNINTMQKAGSTQGNIYLSLKAG